MADDKSNIDRQKRELIRRRAEVAREIESLKQEVASGAGDDRLKELDRVLQQEIQRQAALKQEIEDAKKQLRQLRNENRQTAERRNQIIEDIREGTLLKQEASNTLRSPSSTPAQKAAARRQMEQLREEELVSRRDEAEQAARMASYNTQISHQVGRIESSSADLSMSRRATRAIRSDFQSRDAAQRRLRKAQTRDETLRMDLEDYEARRREKAQSDIDRMTPQGMMGQMRRGLPVDVNFESWQASSALAKAGGTAREQKDIKQATTEFHALFNAIKDTKKSMLDLKEGTDEHAKKQKELTELQGKAAEVAARITKIEQQVEMRGGRGGGSGLMSSVLSGLGDASRFGSQLMGRMGGLATERYVLEEQRKSAELSLRNMGLTDIRNRSTDATAFLATGGGAMFGGESPYGPGGMPSAAIRALGVDYAKTRKAIPQYEVGLNAMGGMFDVANNAYTEGIKMSGITGVSGVTAGLGEALRGGARLGVRTLGDVMSTPELAGPFGLNSAYGFAQDATNALGGAVGSMNKSVIGGGLGYGGGNAAMYAAGSDKVQSGVTGMMNALPAVLIRANETVSEMERLISAEQQGAQVGRVRERLSMAFGPAVQQYMDIQGSQGAILGSSNMTRAQREAYERQLEMSALNPDLAARGFGVNQILGNTAAAAGQLGRFGQGGMNESVARQAMLAQSIGLGDASGSIRFAGAAMQGGVKDPAAMLEKAMKEGLMKGLQDSRAFQGLLDAAVSNADSAANFEGTLSTLLKMSGSGRASDTMTAQAAFKSISKDMSGMSGDWTDTVKFGITNKAAKGVISGAEAKGISLDQEDRTSLQNLANLSMEDLQNEDLVRAQLTPQALKAIESQGGLKKYLSNMNTSMMAHGVLDRAINATQSKDLVALRNMLKAGDRAGIKKMFSGPGGQERLRKVLALTQSGRTSTGDVNSAIGGTQGLANILSDITGVDTQNMGLFGEKFERKGLAGALDEGTAAMTGSEQQRKGQADISQFNLGLGMASMRGPNGENRFAQSLSTTGDQYIDASTGMIKNYKDLGGTTSPTQDVKTIDDAVKEIIAGFKEMKEAMKDFSAQDMVVNATKDVVIKGAQAIKGVVLDNGLTQAASEAGKVIADTVKEAIGTNVSAPGAVQKPAAKTIPSPVK